MYSAYPLGYAPYMNRWTQLPYSETGINLKNKRSERSILVKIRRKYKFKVLTIDKL